MAVGLPTAGTLGAAPPAASIVQRVGLYNALHCRWVAGVTTIPDPDYRALGIEVAKLRNLRGWSIDRLAEESGVDRKSIMNVEVGRHAARVPTLHSLAHAFGVPLHVLIRPLCSGHNT